MIYNPYTIEGKTILITGASSGIGRAVALECSRMGARVILTARNEEHLNETLRQMQGKFHELRLCNLNNTNEIQEMVESLPEIHGVINNAGITKSIPIPFIDEESIKSIFEVNTIAPILLLKYLLKRKKLKTGSSVVFTSSLAGLGYTTVANSVYAASKGAISSFITCAALELAQKGIRVNAVCPGMVDTNILSESVITKEQVEKDKQNYPLKRYGKPEEVAWAMIYLLSEASAWVTGTNMVIDGGYSIR